MYDELTRGDVQKMQEEHAVLSSGDPDEDPVIFPDHAVIRNGGTGKPADFLKIFSHAAILLPKVVPASAWKIS